MIRINEAGEVLFRVYLPEAGRVELMGDFTDWGRKLIPLKREHPGWWEGKVSLGAGSHQFCYLVDGAVRLADYAAHGVHMDRHGQWLSDINVVVVAGRSPAQLAAG